MDKDLIKRLLLSNQINIKDLNKFIVAYVKEEKEKDVTLDELNGIVKLIQTGIFNLELTLVKLASKHNLSLMKVWDSSGQLVKRIVYEN